ncbi:E3 ubiquitin-protein ligase TRIM33-like [Anneissia japonica]|uniref:E3 ubiquitin-protein ligase TRIM33-like n=1 Tax=Anneissia japonica TaxID=1529436 RepID=UPI0014257BC1|nr:E3 ubiquitin-protein ligase TRIM33-like [Anneissia japonica]
MAAKVISDINEKVLLCSICHERFQTPKTLGCQHSFCLKCIKGWMKTNKGILSCPMCRRECKIPDKGLDALPSSYFINQLLEYTANARSCSQEVNYCAMCNKNSTDHCMECSTFLCKQCAKNHFKLPSCRRHTVMPLEQYQSMGAQERAAAKPVMCPKHADVAVRFYCGTCSLPVCIECTVVSHKGHNLQELDTALEQFRKDADKILTQCSTKESELKGILVRHVQNTEAKKQSITKCTQDVRLHAERLHKMVDDAKEKLLTDLTKRSTVDLQNMEEEKKAKEEKIVQLQNVMMFINSLKSAPQPTAALFDANGIIKEANKMIGHPTGRGFKHVDDSKSSPFLYSFSGNKQLTSMISQSIGGVTCQSTNNQARVRRGYSDYYEERFYNDYN